MIKARVIGAFGYGGIGIIELLSMHKEVKIVSLCDVEFIGKRVSDVYPHLRGYCDIVVCEFKNEIKKEADITFCATPDKVGMGYAEDIIASGSKLIDYSGDFRFDDLETYKEYATRLGLSTEHKASELLDKSVYGLTELNREKIKKALIVGNPGCFAVSCILGLYPLFKNDFIDKSKTICDCKTGVSGAGKKPSPQFHFPNRYENMNSYRLTGHQHVMEIEKTLSDVASKDVKVVFTPQVVPVCRGIMSTLYVNLLKEIEEKELIELYKETYKDSKFVKIAEDFIPDNNLTRQTNDCYIKPTLDKRAGIVRIISHIDNLMKGQSGSALQNMNVMFGIDESLGLNIVNKQP
ncbi:MAG: N-acetyl-gamma-glutamyl-phosphate reductase [Candidatus Hydrogenedentota bacterium]